MAFVYKQPGSKRWYVGYAGSDGKQRRKATNLRHDLVRKKDALAHAQKLEEAAHLARVGLLTDTRARSLISEMVERMTGAPLVVHSVEGWLSTWLDGKKSTKAQSTFLSYRKAVTDFLAHLGPERAAQRLELVTVKDFQSFRDKQVQQGKAPQTANDLLKKLRIPFNLARRQGLIPMNPAEAIETLPKERAERGTFTAAQLASLVDAAAGDWQGVILAGIYTGQRLRDITNLRWSALDLPARTLTVVQGKTNRRVTLPLHDSLAAWLLPRADTAGKGSPVFPDLVGKGTGGAHGLSSTFKTLMDRSGIVQEHARQRKEIKGRKGRHLYKLSFHSLRHTFNSILANAGIAQEVRQELTGHASAAMNRIYTHHELAVFQGALEKLPIIAVKTL